MTRENARIKVEQLDYYLSHTCQDYVERDHEAMMMAIKALEQEPKSEWEHDHEILKAYSNGANEILDKLRAEIETERLEDSPNFCVKAHNNAVDRVLQIIDKYKAESEDKE